MTSGSIVSRGQTHPVRRTARRMQLSSWLARDQAANPAAGDAVDCPETSNGRSGEGLCDLYSSTA